MSESTDSTLPNSEQHSALLEVRREKLAALVARGINPYGGKYETTHAPGALHADFQEGLQVRVAGRISAWRDMGKTQFFDISDLGGRIQCFLNAKAAPQEVFDLFKDCLDVGDWIGVEGETFVTKTGEPSIKISGITVLSKALRPMPD